MSWQKFLQSYEQEDPYPEYQRDRKKLDEEMASARTDTIYALFDHEAVPTRWDLFHPDMSLYGQMDIRRSRKGGKVTVDDAFLQVQPRILNSEAMLRNTLAHETAHIAHFAELPGYQRAAEKIAAGAQGKLTPEHYELVKRHSGADPIANAIFQNLAVMTYGTEDESAEEQQRKELAPTSIGIGFYALLEAQYLMEHEGMTAFDAERSVKRRMDKYLPGSSAAFDFILSTDIYDKHPLNAPPASAGIWDAFGKLQRSIE